MKELNLDNLRKVHFIGIGGIGMSSLARLFLHERKKVSGSDRSLGALTDTLRGEGVQIFPHQVSENISPDIDLVVYTDAMPQDHPELVEAVTSGIPTMSYFEALGAIANEYYLIVVTGAHGKTTTTAMIADILEDAGYDPTVVVGSLRARTKSNFRAGKSKFFVVEGDEYRRHFLQFEPMVHVITNIEADHLDYYRNIDDIVQAFHTLALRIPEDGVIICNKKDKLVKKVLKDVVARVVDYTAYVDLALPLKVPGMHNRLNAAAARAAAEFVGIPREEADETLSAFAGTWRRFENKGTMKNGAIVIDDYAHHPSEIKATLAGARELYPEKDITAVFQPHLYSRTEQLFEGFVEALAGADYVIVADIYAARERNTGSIHSKDVVSAIKKINPNVLYLPSFEAIAAELKKGESEKDVIVTMGAGNISELPAMLFL